jgi:isocitrate dehydrogenase
MKRLILNFLASAAVVWGAGLGVAPSLDCVTYDAAHGEVTAYFGYANTNAAAQRRRRVHGPEHQRH